MLIRLSPDTPHRMPCVWVFVNCVSDMLNTCDTPYTVHGSLAIQWMLPPIAVGALYSGRIISAHRRTCVMHLRLR